MAVATVIIPAAPWHESLLARAVESARQQTVPVEVLTYLDYERRGPGYGRNHMAAQVTTPFVITLDADDWLLPHFVETHLKHWRRGSYTYSDWYEADKHVQAVDCYGLMGDKPPLQRSFHLPPTLFPTALYHAIGGYDETLFGAEDTEFYFKANAHGIRSLRIPEPLFVYTDDGRRAKETAIDPRWQALLSDIFGRWKGKMRMGCCGDINVPAVNPGAHLDGDVWAQALWGGNQRAVGAVSGRYYGRIAFPWTGWVDPRDVAAQARLWQVVPDVVALSPDPEAIFKAFAQSTMEDWGSVAESREPLADHIRSHGVKNWQDEGTLNGLNMQQVPEELADLLLAAKERGVKRVLEIGTGEGGLALYMAGALEWDVTSVDPVRPAVFDGFNGPLTFIEGESQDFELPEQPFDVILIDGDHTYEGVKADWEKFSSAADMVAVHDIAPDGFFPDSVAAFWREIAYTKSGNLRAHFHESIADAPTGGKRLGWGWYAKP